MDRGGYDMPGQSRLKTPVFLMMHLTSHIAAMVERGVLSVAAQHRGGKVFRGKENWVGSLGQVLPGPGSFAPTGKDEYDGGRSTTELRDFFRPGKNLQGHFSVLLFKPGRL